jgi:hypothetical protein
MYKLPETGYLRLPGIIGNPKADPPVNLPRKSRHLDLTREEVSDAESRAEEN